MAKVNPLKTTALYTIGTVVNKAIAFVSIPIFSRILSQSEYGVLSSFESYVSIFTVCIGLAIYETIRNAYVDYNKKIESYISSVFTIIILAYLFILTLSFGVNSVLHIAESLLVFLCVSKAFGTAVTNVVSSYYMMDENIYKRTFLLVLPNLIGTVVGILFVTSLHENKYYGRIVPIVAILFFLSIFYIIRFYRSGRTLYNHEIWKYALSLCIPIIPHGLSVTVLASSDRIIISHMTGLEDAGIYGITYNFGMVAFALITAFESVWIPRFTRNMVDNRKDVIQKEVRIYTGFTALVISVILLCSEEIFKVFADNRYWDGVSLLPPIIVASFLIHLYSVPAGAEMYYKKNMNIAIASISAAIINIILNYICISRWGYKAAAYTTVFSYAILFFIHYHFIAGIDSDLYPIKLFLPSIVIIVCAWTITVLFKEIVTLRWGIGIAIVFFAIIVLLMYRKRLVDK